MRQYFIPLVLALSLFAAMPARAGTLPPLPQKSPAIEQPQTAGPVVKIEVRKQQRRMYLLDKDNNVVHSYHISLGWSPKGRKTQEGDGKTPEGNYIIDTRNERSDYYRSLHISYPGKDDIARAKKMHVSPGGDVFIHGKPDFKFWMFWKYNKMNDWTNGCIAVDDSDMHEIWDLVQDGTPITINP